MKKKTLLTFLVPCIAVLLSLVVGEIGLRLLEKHSGRRFDDLASVFAESFFFHYWKPGDRLYPGAALFDPLLGWHAGPRENPKPVKETYNAQGWRSTFPYVETKTRRRVILIGDSYTFGSNLSDEDTIGSRLQSLLGSSYEVMTIAAEGFGVDQMAIAATKLAPRYHPDFLILAFIADDLRRSCLSFAWGGMLKPYYVVRGDGVEARGIPVLSPQENARRHRQWRRRLVDALETYLSESRVVNLLLSPLLGARQNYCIETLNARILKGVKDTVSPKTGLIFAHLDGRLPPGFLANAKRMGLLYLSLAEEEGRIAARLHVTPGTVDGYHPNKARAQIIATLYGEQIASRSRHLQ